MSEDYRELLIGCGRARDKRVRAPWSGDPQRVGEASPSSWHNLITLDLNPNCGADLQCDLQATPPWIAYPMNLDTLYRDHDSMLVLDDEKKQRGIDTTKPLFKGLGERPGVYKVAHELLSDYWNEIHAYEVLEHLGQQGDANSFFAQFSELYRLLKPNGYLCATVPSRFSPWLWGDPSHRRAIVSESLVFLDQAQYQIQIDQIIAASQPPTAMSDFRDTLNYRADFKLVDSHDNRTMFTFILQAVKPSRGVSV